MTKKITFYVETEKRGLFGTKRVKEKRTIKIDDKKYKELKKRQKAENARADAIEATLETQLFREKTGWKWF